ncbi:Lactonase, 7-bladed beta-propeller-domain-containing protein [Aspergillus coremiiformis]|uniref:Lactonase, 7-bladed beta-propeller-domain-containing protein n=1 Tax=Aspergillus coremiiformis TaxID=138285 RepID=A0A5N6Z0W8_9EURO|nr:Lactonase, 7-bladed beta-propeller-domain-containing protein [Aspergillus coremiiformis]
MFLQSFFALSLALPTLSSAAKIYATHYDGNVYFLDTSGDSNNLELKKAVSLTACGGTQGSPSSLNADPARGLLWCTGEGTPGVLAALEVQQNGELKEMFKTETLGGGVNSALFGKDNQFLAIAHYGAAAISVYKVPFTNNETAKPVQVVNFPKLANATDKEGVSKPHQVFLDPTSKFLLSPDLGLNKVHVFKIDQDSGNLDICENSAIHFAPGSGPRYGVFVKTNLGQHKRQIRGLHREWQTKRQGDSSFLYTVNERNGRLCKFSVSYPNNACPVFTEVDCFVPYPGEKLPNENATLAQVHAAGSTLHISVRKDHKFKQADSLVTLDLTRNVTRGSVTDDNLFSSGGLTPRSFVINKAGDLVAVANQDSSTVVIIKRDPQTGKLQKELTSQVVGQVPEEGKWGGLSSIVWYE